MKTRLTGLAALLLLLLVLIGLPTVLLSLGLPAVGSLSSPEEFLATLTRPDDGTLFVGLIAAAGWVTWLVLSLCVLLEVAAALRGSQTPSLPGLTVPQVAARQLVAATALLFVVPTTVDQAATAFEYDAKVSLASEAPSTMASMLSATSSRSHARKTPDVVTRTVKPGESLWSIAEEVLGSGERYDELRRLNADLLDGAPDHIESGWTLVVPRPTDPRMHVVQPGETLSGIAADEYGDATAYPRIFHASQAIAQPDADKLVNPDHIEPGWTLRVPQSRRPPHGEEPARLDPDRRRTPEAPPVRSPAPSARPSAPGAQAPKTDADKPASGHDATREDEQAQITAPWVLLGLTGGGALLAASLYRALRRRRREQFRSRRPGRAIPSVPSHLASVERTILAAGPQAVPVLEQVHDCLRQLGVQQTGAGARMPRVAAVELKPGALLLHLTEPADLPDPWVEVSARLHWKCPTDAPWVDMPALDDASPAPYPLLVTLGTADSGDVWLFNLEEFGVLSLAGDQEYSADFVRHAVAELATAPWAREVYVDCIGDFDDLTGVRPSRVTTRCWEEGADALERTITRAVGEIDRQAQRPGDQDLPTVRALPDVDLIKGRLLVAGSATGASADNSETRELLSQLVELISSNPVRTGTAAVLLDQDAAVDGFELRFSTMGRVHAPSAGLDLIPVGLTADEARGCAAILAQSETSGDVDMPVDTAATSGWRGRSDLAGGLRPEQTVPRQRLEETPEEVASVLRASDADYVDLAATTAEDLQALAPAVTNEVRESVEDSDPTLDADIAAWFDPDCPSPRLTLLGPVGVEARGPLEHRKPYYTEVVAFLALHPHGAVTEQIMDAFAISSDRVRKVMSVVRDWLGVNPRTGRDHLPDATDSRAAKSRGVRAYQVEDLLLDADLFRRLRVRGTARGGQAGQADLRRALSLVTGRPFDQLRPNGWTWLWEGDRLDHHLTVAIIDVAHVVTTHALLDDDPASARAANEVALRVAPNDEPVLLDLARINQAEGHDDEAERVISEDLCNRWEEGEPPLDLSPRSEEILRRWTQADQAAS